MTTTADILDAAADAIETYGHAKGTYGDEHRGFCAMGAIKFAAAADRAKELFALHAFQEALGRSNMADWNDDTTAFDVIDLMRHTAKRLRNTHRSLD
jgi:hypothetical protein